jgi:hypothetical protein
VFCPNQQVISIPFLRGNRNNPAVVIEGEAESTDILEGFNPNVVILANAATHKQYANVEEVVEPTTKRFQYYKQIGEEGGCSENNKRFFFVKHVFCDNLGGVE